MDAMAQPPGVCQLCEGTVYGDMVTVADEDWCAGCWVERHSRDFDELMLEMAEAVCDVRRD